MYVPSNICLIWFNGAQRDDIIIIIIIVIIINSLSVHHEFCPRYLAVVISINYSGFFTANE
jgi:hypothetical protein